MVCWAALSFEDIRTLSLAPLAILAGFWAMVEISAGLLPFFVEALREVRKAKRIDRTAQTKLAEPVKPKPLHLAKPVPVPANPVEAFLEQCTHRMANRSIPAKELYATFARWCKARGIAMISSIAFGKETAKLGIPKEKRGSIIYTGISLVEGLEDSWKKPGRYLEDDLPHLPSIFQIENKTL